MGSNMLLKAVLSCVYVLSMASASMTSKLPQAVEDENLDAFQVFAGFSHIVAISDINNDTIFECLTAKRTKYDPDARTATYVVKFNGHHGGQKKKVGFHVSKGPSPDLFEFTEDEQPVKREVGEMRYTDFQTCFISRFLYISQQCFLYVSKGVEEHVPRHCTGHFADICGVAIPTYSRDLCPDEEED